MTKRHVIPSGGTKTEEKKIEKLLSKLPEERREKAEKAIESTVRIKKAIPQGEFIAWSGYATVARGPYETYIRRGRDGEDTIVIRKKGGNVTVSPTLKRFHDCMREKMHGKEFGSLQAVQLAFREASKECSEKASKEIK